MVSPHFFFPRAKVMGTAEAHLGQALNSAEEGITKVLEDINVSEGIKQIQGILGRGVFSIDLLFKLT